MASLRKPQHRNDQLQKGARVAPHLLIPAARPRSDRLRALALIRLARADPRPFTARGGDHLRARRSSSDQGRGATAAADGRAQGRAATRQPGGRRATSYVYIPKHRQESLRHRRASVALDRARPGAGHTRLSRRGFISRAHIAHLANRVCPASVSAEHGSRQVRAGDLLAVFCAGLRHATGAGFRRVHTVYPEKVSG